MILNIAEAYDKSFKEDNFNLGTSMLFMKATHLFIASNYWDTVNIQLTDNIPEGSLRGIHLCGKEIKVQLPNSLTDKTIRLLTELLPEKAGLIRKSYLQGTDLKEVLVDCVV